jgi:hypothetical protein
MKRVQHQSAKAATILAAVGLRFQVKPGWIACHAPMPRTGFMRLIVEFRWMASADDGTYRPSQTFLFKRRAFILKPRMPRSEHTMNIFYIIGVVVVIIFVASFLGLHV